MFDTQKNKDNKVSDVVNYLSRAFSKATSKASGTLGTKAIRTKNARGIVETTPLYDYQVEFCYLIDKIQRGPKYISSKVIQEANELIDEINAIGSI